MEKREKRKKVRSGLAYVMVSILLTLLFMIPVVPTQADAAVPKTTVSKKTLYVGGDSYQIRFKNLASDATVTYKSSDTSVAKVTAKGVIKPVAKGTATITVKIVQNSKTYTSKIAVTVKNPYVWISNRVSKLVQGSDYQLVANPYGLKDAELKFTSSNVLVVKIDSETGMMHARGAGTAKITVTDTVSGTTATMTVKVVEKTEENLGDIYVETSGMSKDYVYTAPENTENLTEEEKERIEYLTDIQDRITKGRSITVQEMTDYYEEKSADEREE